LKNSHPVTASLLSSLNNPLFKSQQRCLKDSKFCKKNKLIWLEGEKFLDLLPPSSIKALFIGPETPEKKWPCPPLRLSEKLARLAFQHEHPQEIGALIHWSPHPFESLKSSKGLLILDGLQDPGNVGSLIRSAAALDLGGVILCNSVQVTNIKLLRSSAGSFLHIPLHESRCLPSLQKKLNDTDVSCLIAQTTGEKKFQPPPKWALILGSEAKGPQDSWQGDFLSIPLKKLDSLNVAAAGAILMHRLKSLP
jgi:tRNA G18 (ribose-2'-O)-methylase SpoU